MGRKWGFGLLAAAAIVGQSTFGDCVEDGMPLWKRSMAPPAISGADSIDRWSYGYDSLKQDLAAWDAHPLIKVDSIGASAQGRGIWQLAITGDNDSVGRPGEPAWRKRRVFVHARTHPGEIQSHHVSKAMIAFLLDSGSVSREIRRDYIFNLIPMYNPDGVELKRPRTNSNGVDIESNWDHPSPQPEVLALRRHLTFLMASHVPAEVALNLHSDSLNCTRFFFFHEAGGTSAAFVELEKEFIGKVRSYFASGIEDWFFAKSWGSATGTRYPEGWWWTNFRERVMALTYEDRNCPGAGEYDSTAIALVRGAVDYLRPRIAAVRPVAGRETRLLRVPGGLRVEAVPGRAYSGWSLLDLAGRPLGRGGFGEGGAIIPSGRLPKGPVILALEGAGPRLPERLLLPSGVP